MSVLNPVIDHLDLATKHIYLLAGTVEYHPVSDIYVEVRNIRRLNESMRVFDMPVTAFGGVSKGGGKYTSRYTRFNNGWKVVPDDVSHSLYITGEQITDDGQSGPACIDTTVLSAGTSVIIHYEPPASELVKAADEIAAIKRMAFNERVAVDQENSTGKATTSLDFPAGTRQAPAADLTTALTIANLASYGFKEFFLESNLDIVGAVNLNGFLIEGNNHVDTVLTIDTAASVENLKVIHCTLDNTTLDGDVDIEYCVIKDISYLNGHIHNCGLMGTIILGGNRESLIESCYTVDQDFPVIIDMNGTGNDLAMPNYSGLATIRNLTSATEEIGVGLNAGMIIFDETITAGTGVVAGTGLVMDNSGPGFTVNLDGLVNIPALVEAIMGYTGP